MKKFLSGISLIISAALLLLVFAGCGNTQKKENGGIPFVEGEGEAITLYNSLAASMPMLTAAPTEIPSKAPASATVITDEMMYTAGDGITDDSALLRQGIDLAAVYSTGVFVISSEIKIEESILIPSNVILEFRGEGKIILGDSAYLYFENGSKIIAGTNKIFSGAVNNLSLIADDDPEKASEELVFAVRAEWFGASSRDGLNAANCDGAAIQAAANFATKVYLGAGQYLVNRVVTLPSSHPVEIIGSGRDATELVLGLDASSYFTADGATVGIYDMNIAQIGHYKTATFLTLTNGSLKVSAVACYGIGTVFNLNNSSTVCEYLFANNNTEVYNAANCNGLIFNSSLGNGNKNFLIATNCSNISATNSSSVWNYGTDYTFINCHGIVMNALGCDLGYDAVQIGTTTPIYGYNYYAIYMEGCYDFTLKNLWCASNSGMSYTHSPSTGVSEATQRTGMYFTGCYKGTVAYSTITNHPTAVKILNSPAAAATAGNEIVFLANQFVGNKNYEVFMESANNVAFRFNNHKQYGALETNNFPSCVEVAGNNCSNISFVGDTFYSITSIAALKGNFVNTPESEIHIDSIMNANTGYPIFS